MSVALVNAPAKVTCPKLNGSSPHYTHFAAAPPTCINTAKTYTAKIVTDIGTMTAKLVAAQDPASVNNFVFLAGYHFFDGTAFHRVCTGFVDQGGDPTGTGTGGVLVRRGSAQERQRVHQRGAGHGQLRQHEH